MMSNNSGLRHVVKAAYAKVPFKAPLFSAARSIMPLPERVYRHLHFTGPFQTEIVAGHTFQMYHHGNQIENDLFWAGFGKGWEATSLVVWSLLARQSSLIFDIGANTGVFAMTAKCIAPASRVIGFEPVQRIAAKLKLNASLNDFDIEIVEAAASNQSGVATIYVPNGDHNYSASLEYDMLSGKGVEEVTIATTRIDRFVQDNRLSRIDLVKIDAERHEADVLAGFGELIERDTPALMIEVLDAELGARLMQLIPSNRYDIYEIAERDGLRRIERPGGGDRNYLFCTPEQSLHLGLSNHGHTTHEQLESRLKESTQLAM